MQLTTGTAEGRAFFVPEAVQEARPDTDRHAKPESYIMHFG